MKKIVVFIVLISFFGYNSIAQKRLGVYTKSKSGYLLRVNNQLGGVIFEQDSAVLEFMDTLVSGVKFRVLTIYFESNCNGIDVFLLDRKLEGFKILGENIEKQNEISCSYLIPYATKYIALKYMSYQIIKLPRFFMNKELK